MKAKKKAKRKPLRAVDSLGCTLKKGSRISGFLLSDRGIQIEVRNPQGNLNGFRTSEQGLEALLCMLQTLIVRRDKPSAKREGCVVTAWRATLTPGLLKPK